MKAILTTYKDPTNTRGARIIAKACDNNTVSISMPIPAEGVEAHKMAAQALCDKMRWKGKLAGGAIKNGYTWFFVD